MAKHRSLRANELPVDEFLEVLVEKLKKKAFILLLIYKQENFLKNQKETLCVKECIIIIYFAENDTIMVEDAIQSFHWNNTQAIMHPFVIYYK